MTITGNKISWTPANGVTTSGEVTLTVSDGDLSVTEKFTVAVTAVNDAPVITSTAPTTATEDIEYNYTISASDIDNATLTYSISGEPAGMTISGNKISWTPAKGITTSGEVTLTVSDGDLSVTEKFTVAVSVQEAIEAIEAKTKEVYIYPNPTTEGFYINVGKIPTNIDIYTLNGKMVLCERVINKTFININHLPQGIYLIKVNAKTIKLVKK
jgi:hypothetical protein